VNGIVRRNARTLRALEARRRAADTPVAEAEVAHEVAALRERERVELRAVLHNAKRVQFDRNLALLDERAR
jgi:hypothetical protein